MKKSRRCLNGSPRQKRISKYLINIIFLKVSIGCWLIVIRTFPTYYDDVCFDFVLLICNYWLKTFTYITLRNFILFSFFVGLFLQYFFTELLWSLDFDKRCYSFVRPLSFYTNNYCKRLSSNFHILRFNLLFLTKYIYIYISIYRYKTYKVNKSIIFFNIFFEKFS